MRNGEKLTARDAGRFLYMLRSREKENARYRDEIAGWRECDAIKDAMIDLLVDALAGKPRDGIKVEENGAVTIDRRMLNPAAGRRRYLAEITPEYYRIRVTEEPYDPDATD